MMMSIIDILDRTDHSVDFGGVKNFEDSTDFWIRVITSKAADTGFGYLVDDYFENGWREGSEIGWNDGSITEGHHRLVMAILLCLDEVPVSTYGAESYGRRLSAHGNWDFPYPIEVDFAA